MRLKGRTKFASNTSARTWSIRGGLRTKEVYSNILSDGDVDASNAASTTSFTVAQQLPGGPFELLVAGHCEGEREGVDGKWRCSDRYVFAQYHNNLDKHMHPGSQPYN